MTISVPCPNCGSIDRVLCNCDRIVTHPTSVNEALAKSIMDCDWIEIEYEEFYFSLLHKIKAALDEKDTYWKNQLGESNLKLLACQTACKLLNEDIAQKDKEIERLKKTLKANSEELVDYDNEIHYCAYRIRVEAIKQRSREALNQSTKEGK